MDLTDEQIENLKSIVRMGIDFETACLSQKIPEKEIKALSRKKETKTLIRQAEAEFRVLVHKAQFEDGGAAGLRWIFEKFEKSDNF